MASESDLQARQALAERSLVAHDFILRALLTHLALTEPRSFEGIVAGFTNSRLYGSKGSSGELTREVTEQLVELMEDVASSLKR